MPLGLSSGQAAKKSEPKGIPTPTSPEGADGPDDHYVYSLKDFQPFESLTYQGGWVRPLGAVEKLERWLV